MAKIVRTNEEIEEVIAWVHEVLHEGTHYSGMTYEQGIDDFWLWLIGASDNSPAE